MARNRLEQIATQFNASAEALNTEFLSIKSDEHCTDCRSAGFGRAILTAWLQARWVDFNHDLMIASALGTRRRHNAVRPIAGVNATSDAERLVGRVAGFITKERGLALPIWHAPWFVVQVGSELGLRNISTIQAALAPTSVPDQIACFRNFLVHPGTRTEQKYHQLQAKLGLLQVEPQDLLDHFQTPGVMIFTAWVRELQRLAYAATQ